MCEVIMSENLFVEFDEIIKCGEEAEKYAKDHSDELIGQVKNADKMILTSKANWLGLADPSLIGHRIVRGAKRGRVIKKIPENGEHTELYYRKGRFIAVRSYNSFGTEVGYYTFERDGYVWAINFYYDKKNDLYFSCGDKFRFRYDEKGRIVSYYQMDSSWLSGEEYEYPEDEALPIKARHYYYVPRLNGSSKDIPTGYPNSPMDEAYYEISADQKIIREYIKKGEDYVFTREYISTGKKQTKPKPAEDTYEKLEKWLDSLLDHIPEGAKGLFFCLDEGTEDGFGIDPYFTSQFDAEDDDWACTYIANPQELFVSVNGTLEYQEILKHALRFLRKYVKEGNGRNKLRSLDGAGVGFSDGESTVIYTSKNKRTK